MCVCVHNCSILHEATNTTYPGYMNHEAVAWSDILKKWIFCPRKVSEGPYSDLDEKVRTLN